MRRPPQRPRHVVATIAAETKVRPDEIEHLIMKALSLGLLRGTIDQVRRGGAHLGPAQGAGHEAD